MTEKASIGDFIGGRVSGYVITSSSNKSYVFSDINRAALCAAGMGSLDILDSISLILKKGAFMRTLDISLDSMMDRWQESASAPESSLSEYRQFPDQEMPDYFSKLGFYFIL